MCESSRMKLSILGLLVCVASCNGKSDNQKPHQSPTTDSTPTNCAGMDRYECMHAPQCSLVQETSPSQDYLCRPVQGPCEKAVLQGLLSNPPGSKLSVAEARANQKKCSDTLGCVYDPGNCFCDCKGYGKTAVPDHKAPDCLCACSGGPPQICRAIVPD